MTNRILKIFFFNQTNIAKLSWIKKGIIIQDLRDLRIRSVKSTTRRPEHKDTAQTFYITGAKTYGTRPRVVKIQKELYQRAVTLLNINNISNLKFKSILDLGCGIGLFQQYLCHMCNLNCTVIGVDISQEMLNKTLQSNKNGYTGLILNDLGQGVPLRPESIDAAISISTLQWIMGPRHIIELDMFLKSLGQCLTQNGRAVMQFYPNCSNDVEALIKTTSKYFTGALVADFPHNDNAVKLFLCLENLS